MHASKENAAKAAAAFVEIAAALPDGFGLKHVALLGRVSLFLAAAERKLPTEAAYDKEATRKKSKMAKV